MPTDPKSPAESWLSRNFTQRHALCTEIGTDLRSHTPIPVDVTHKSFLGNLMEYAIGLSLCDRPPYLDRFRLLGVDQAARLLGLAGYQKDGTSDRDAWWRGATTPAPAGVFLAAYRLAQINELLNPRWGGRPDPEIIARILERHPDALPRHGGETSFERLAFDDLWTSYSGGFCAALRSYGTATAQIPLLDGLRQADFFVGTTILEVKSGRLDQDPLPHPADQPDDQLRAPGPLRRPSSHSRRGLCHSVPAPTALPDRTVPHPARWTSARLG